MLLTSCDNAVLISLSLSWCRLREGSQGGRGLVSVVTALEHKLYSVLTI